MTRARRPPRTPHNPSHRLPRLRASTPPNAPTPSRRPAKPASSPRAKAPPKTFPRATPPPKATPPRRPNRRRRNSRTTHSAGGGGRLVRLEGLVGILHVPVLHLVLVRPHPLSRPPYFIPPRPFDSCLSTPPASTLVPLRPQRLLELRIRLPQVRGREGPRVCERDDRRGRRGAREEGISRSRAPRARARASTRRASSERTDVASGASSGWASTTRHSRRRPSNVAVRDDACCWPSGCALAASAGCVAEDGGRAASPTRSASKSADGSRDARGNGVMPLAAVITM